MEKLNEADNKESEQGDKSQWNLTKLNEK